MMEHALLRAGRAGCALLLAIGLASCGGHAVQPGEPSVLAPLDTPGSGAPATPAAPPAQAQFPGLPSLPSGPADLPQQRSVSLVDNRQTGSQAVQSAAAGVFVDGPRLDMGPLADGKCDWALWRWGKFTGTVRPQQLAVDLTVTGTNKYWLLLGNYDSGQWEVQGPLTSGSKTFDFPPAAHYVSPAGNAYIAILGVGANTFVVNALNLLADDDVTAPGPPTSLLGNPVYQHSAQLNWQAPADPDVHHYELYQVPTASAGDDDPLTVPVSLAIPAANTVWQLKPLQAVTHYIYRLRAVDAAGNKSPLSVAGEFTTQANQPPVPAFSFSPSPVMKSVAITFDPGATTDADDPPASLTCAWDWNNDGVDDTVSTGLSPVTHAFHQQQLATVKLSVWDGTDRVATTQTVEVQPFSSYRLLAYEQAGEGSELIASATEYSTGRVATVLRGGGQPRLVYYDGAQWGSVDMQQLFVDNAFASVALGPGGKIGVLMYRTGSPLKWYLYETTGSGWTLAHSMAVPPSDSDNDPLTDPVEQVFASAGSLAYAPNGRITVALDHSKAPTAFPESMDWLLSVYHERSDGTFEEGPLLWQHPAEDWAPFTYYGVYSRAAPPFAVSRTDTQSTLVYANPKTQTVSTEDVRTDTYTDAGDTIASQQSYINRDVGIACGVDPQNPTQVFWALSTYDYALNTTYQIYYGDNYGAPNGAGQHRDLSFPIVSLLGAKPSGDNKGLFYWAEKDEVVSDDTFIRGYNSGTGALLQIRRGVGLCDAGSGGWVNQGGVDGMYVATGETRDGEVTGYFLQGGNIGRVDPIAVPASGGFEGAHSRAFTTPQGGLTILSAQTAPIAQISTSTSFTGPFTTGQLGLDTWAYPDAAAPDSVPGEILLGSLYLNSTSLVTDLVLNQFTPGSTVGTELGVVKNTQQAAMAYNPKSGQTLLAAVEDGGYTLTARVWGGSSWSGPVTIASAGGEVADAVLRPRPDGEWGVAWDTVGSTIQLAETAGGVWQAPQTLSSAVLHLPNGSLDLAYTPAGDAMLVAERDDGINGIYYGYKPLGSSSASWELTNGTKGFTADSLEVHWLPETGPVVCYNVFTHSAGGGLRFITKPGGVWNTANLPFYLQGAPLSSASGPDGLLAFTGQYNSTGQAVVFFLNW